MEVLLGLFGAVLRFEDFALGCERFAAGDVRAVFFGAGASTRVGDRGWCLLHDGGVERGRFLRAGHGGWWYRAVMEKRRWKGWLSGLCCRESLVLSRP